MNERAKIRALAAYHVAGARLGIQRDFAALVTLFNTRLRAHARRLCDDAETARDIVQEAWIAIARGLPGLRDDHAFLPWALRIVTRSAARDLGHKRRRRTALQGFTETLDDTPIEAPDLSAAIATLPVPQRAALTLFYLEEMTVAEVAVALDIPPGTVKTRLMHARNKLRAFLDGERNGQT